jgi:hypothetical protein
LAGLPLRRLALKHVHYVSEKALSALLLQCTSLRNLNVTATDINIQKVASEFNHSIHSSTRTPVEFVKKTFDPEKFAKREISYSSKCLCKVGAFSYPSAKAFISALSQCVGCSRLEIAQSDSLLHYWSPMITDSIAVTKSLTDINISNSNLGDEGVLSLAKALTQNKQEKLESLTLNQVGLGSEGLQAILAVFRGSHLDLQSNVFGLEGCHLLQKMLEEKTNNGLKTLLLCCNHFGDEGASVLLQGLAATTVEKKDVVSAELVLDLRCSIYIPKFKVFRDCSLTSHAGRSIGTMLWKNPNLMVVQ